MIIRIASTFLLLMLSQTGWPLTLPEAVKRAKQWSPVIQILEADVNTSQARLNQIRGIWHPQIRLKMEKGASRTQDDSWTNLTRSQVQMTQLIYDFQKSAYQSESGEHTLDYKRLQLQEGVQRLALLVATAYLELLKLKQVLTLVDQNIAAYEQFLAIMKKRESAGVASFSDVQRVNGLLQSTRKEKLVYEADQRFASEAFTLLVGQAPESLQLPEFKRLQISDRKEEILQQAKTGYYGARAKEFQLRSARAALNESRQSLYPEINFEGSMTKERSLGSGGNNALESEVKLVVTYDLWDGFIGRNQLHEKKSLFMRSQFQLDDYMRTLEKDVGEAFSTMTRLKEELAANNDFLEINRKVVELYQKEFVLGQKSVLEMTIAQADFHKAQTDDVTLFFDYYSSVFNVLFYVNAVTRQIDAL